MMLQKRLRPDISWWKLFTLASDIKQDFCGKIFLHYPYMSKNENDLIWKYLNKNKQLFVYKSNTVKDKEFFKWSRKSISYFNPTNLDKLSDGYLYVTVVHTFPDKFYAGIYKEIAFPIVRDEASGEFRIVFYNIKINGILIDYKNEFVRDFDIIENLGFKSEQNRNKLNQKQ